ncbi:hypothetical protein C8Q77DRAFT_1058772 [Trametes polyzona]|nr:hypothetical protein C8Q77DRAFT_1058772 [Trametes polyzona]
MGLHRTYSGQHPEATNNASGSPSGPRRQVEVVEVPDVDDGGLPSKAWVEDYPATHRDCQTRERTKLSFESNYMFYKKIDALPRGQAKWSAEVFEAVGDMVGEDGLPRKEVVELWKRDPVDCIRELIGNPLFRDCIRYAPEKHYVDEDGTSRMYGNTWTGNWWWETQTRLPSGATVAPVILASDKTTLSRMSGDKSAWPVYLTIGNIDKNTRRKPSAHATVLLGYIPVTKLECFSDKRRSLEGYRLFHMCMRRLLDSLVHAGQEGILMTCADGRVRRVFPILAIYVADHPEQCLVSGCQENYCPKCTVGPDKRGEPAYSDPRDPATITAILKAIARGEKPPDFSDQGLRAVEPFWADLPHADIFTALTPDLLHQLHKGVFKDHLVSWVTQAMEGGATELDRRFKAMFKHSDLRHFGNGISLVSQWTGTEYKNMEKVFLGITAGAVDERVTRAVRAILDFIYLAHFETHTDVSLTLLNDAWRDFHTHKQVFVDLGIRTHFNFPKAHSMQHYEASIRSTGTADGCSTEHPERLHIDFAKLAYGATNKQSTYIEQMTRWLERQEAVHRFASYLAWSASAKSDAHLPTPPTSGQHSYLRASSDHNAGDHRDATFHHDASNSMGQPQRPSTLDDNDNDNDDNDIVANLRGHRVAKTPAYPSLTVAQLEHDFGATHLKHALATYLKRLAGDNAQKQALISTPLHDLSRISAYKQAKVPLPAVCQVSPVAPLDIIHATPSRAASRVARGRIPPNMSTVLARDPGPLDAPALRPMRRPPAFDPTRPLTGMSHSRARCARCHANMNNHRHTRSSCARYIQPTPYV